MTHSERTVIFWGAGATASLEIQTTDQQAGALQALASKQGRSPLAQRVEKALGKKAREPWTSALRDLLIILGDGDDNPITGKDDTVRIMPHHIDLMRAYWRHGASVDELRSRITALRTLYDWPALKAAIKVCPAATTVGAAFSAYDPADDSFRLNDLFNVLDMHGQSGHGFRAEDGEFLTPQRVLGARNALKMLLQTILYIDWHCGREVEREGLELHYDFAVALGRRMQRLGLELAGQVPFDDRRFYMGDVGFACFNWDPIALWCQFVANRCLNRSGSVPHVGSPACKLQVYHDLGHFVAGRRVKDKGQGVDTPWHPMNESAALRLNDTDHGSSDRIRISKFLLPHGCLWWRECPNCGKLSSYMGDAWEWDSPTLIPPPPFKAFVRDEMFDRRRPEECKAWDEGAVDARACVHCKTLTYAHHTQTVMQSSFKGPPPPFLDEIKRDLRVAVQEADHIVLMGYTLPPDDVDYRAFLAARRRRTGDVRCSVVVGKDCGRQWFGPSAWPAMLERMPDGLPPRTTLEAARDLFGEENVRFYGGGIPHVFLDGGSVTDAAVERLLTWESA